MGTPHRQVVRDDVVLFAAGNQIPADAVVLTGRFRSTSLLTGEPDAIVKRPGDTLLSGSFVVAGGRAQLTKVGAESYASRLTLEAKKDAGPGQSEMMNSLDKLIRSSESPWSPWARPFAKQYFSWRPPLSTPSPPLWPPSSA